MKVEPFSEIWMNLTVTTAFSSYQKCMLALESTFLNLNHKGEVLEQIRFKSDVLRQR